MAHRSAGTLALPWSQTSQRSGKQRVAADHALLAVTMTLALVGLVMVFSASAIVAGNRFQDPAVELPVQFKDLCVERLPGIVFFETCLTRLGKGVKRFFLGLVTNSRCRRSGGSCRNDRNGCAQLTGGG